MTPKAAISRPYASRSDIIYGRHLKGIHLHLDINGDHEEVRAALNPFVAKHHAFLHWDDFLLPTLDALRNAYADRYRSEWDQYLEIMADPCRFGAPQAHLSATKFYGSIFSSRFKPYLDLFQEGMDLMAALPFSGYIELEDVLEERLKKESKQQGHFGEQVSMLAGGVIAKVDLTEVKDVDYGEDGYLAVSENSRRYFRTTEIHLTFRDLHLVHPAAIAHLIDIGFCSAYQINRTGQLKFIATIQGFEREIYQIYCDIVDWIQRNGEAIHCEVMLKREQILSYFIFGDSPNIQQVVRSHSLSEVNG